MVSLASPTYWDFDQFQEVRINTGGADVRNQSPGAAVDVILKSGGNQYHGSLRSYFANEGLQRNNLSTELRNQSAGRPRRATGWSSTADYGFEVGGPLVEDRLWAWGSLGETDIRLRTLIDTGDRTTLTNRALKVQGRSPTGCASASTTSTERRPSWAGTPGPRGRTRPRGTRVGMGAGLFTGSATWGRKRHVRQRQGRRLQQRLLPDAPRRSGRGGRLSRRESRVPQFLLSTTRSYRPQRVASVDANYFRGDHELKARLRLAKERRRVRVHLAGVGAARHPSRRLSRQRADAARHLRRRRAERRGPVSELLRERPLLEGSPEHRRRRPVRTGRPHRCWRRAGRRIPWSRTSCRRCRLRLWKTPHVFSVVAPRVGLSYALGAEGRTRSCARATASSHRNCRPGLPKSWRGRWPTRTSITWPSIPTATAWRNGDELLLDAPGIVDAVGFDPADPTSTDSVNRVASDLTSPRTHELIFGVDRELPIPNSVLAASVTLPSVPPTSRGGR